MKPVMHSKPPFISACTEAGKIAGNVARRIAAIVHQFRYNGPRVGPFVFARTAVCGVPMQLMTHNNDKVISEWVRTGKNWSRLALAQYQQVAEYACTASTIVDVGANIGILSILVSRAAPDAKIFAIEADPLNFALSQINLEMNGCHNVTAVNAAIADYTGSILLHRDRQNWGDHRTYAPNEASPELASQARRTVAIDPTALFSAVRDQPGPGYVDLIKISTQGSDVKILKAFHPLLRSGSRVMLQFSPSHLQSNGTTEENIRQSLSPAGKVQAIGPKADSKGGWVPRDVTVDELVDFYRTGTRGFRAAGYCHVLAGWR